MIDGPVPWFQSFLLALLSLGPVMLVFSVICLVGGLLLLVPPSLIRSNVFDLTAPALGIVLTVDDERMTAAVAGTPAVQITDDFSILGELAVDMVGSETIKAMIADESGEYGTIPVTGATVLSNGEPADDWLCGLVYWNSELRVFSATIDPNIASEPVGADDGVAIAAVPDDDTVWERSRPVGPMSTALDIGPATGVQCVRTLDAIHSDDAGDRWFTLTNVQVGVLGRPARADAAVPATSYLEQDVYYSQDVDIVKPRTWTETSGLNSRDGGEDPQSSFVEDQLAVFGEVKLSLPVQLEPPGTNLTYVFRDEAVVSGNAMRVGLGWLVLGVWLGVLVPVLVARMAKLRREQEH